MAQPKCNKPGKYVGFQPYLVWGQDNISEQPDLILGEKTFSKAKKAASIMKKRHRYIIKVNTVWGCPIETIAMIGGKRV